MLKVVLRLSNLVVSRIWGAWAQYADHAHCQRDKSSTFVYRMRNLKMLKAFTRWRDVDRAIHAEEARKQVLHVQLLVSVLDCQNGSCNE